jgi:hypothetical protein
VIHECGDHLLSLRRTGDRGSRGKDLVLVTSLLIGGWAVHRVGLRLEEIGGVARNSNLSNRIVEALRIGEVSLESFL